MQRRPLHIETFGAELQSVHAGMGLRIGDIGPGAGPRLFVSRAARGIGSRRGGIVELPKPDCRELADETREVAKMMGGRGVRDTGFARDRPQCQPGKPIALQHPLRRLQEAGMQPAVMIGRVLASNLSPRRALGTRRPRRRSAPDALSG